MINSRSLDDLHPAVKVKATFLLAKCLEEGIDVLITSTFRDAESQNALYAVGRTKPGKKLTNAKGGESFHQWHVAFDFVPLVNGKPDWQDTELFTKVGEIGESVGLEWAGRWKRFPEYAHLQYTNGLSIHDFQAGKSF